jgi:DNA modification methylase
MKGGRCDARSSRTPQTLKIHQGDALQTLANIPSESIHCCVTSPPYWGLRDYGVDGQIGLEDSLEEWVSKMVEVFREVRRVLRPDGTLWLNLGDGYNGYMANQRASSISANNQHARPIFKKGHGPRTVAIAQQTRTGHTTTAGAGLS